MSLWCFGMNNLSNLFVVIVMYKWLTNATKAELKMIVNSVFMIIPPKISHDVNFG